MPALEISHAELYPAELRVTPRLGASIAEWATFRARVPRLALPAPTQEPPKPASASKVWPAIPPHLLKGKKEPKSNRPSPMPLPAPPDYPQGSTPAARLAALPRECLLEGRPSVSYIKAACCAYYKVRKVALEGYHYNKTVVRARHVAVYLCCDLTIHHYPAISRHFSDRDHSTIAHSFRKITEELQADAALRAEVEAIKRAVLEGGQGRV